MFLAGQIVKDLMDFGNNGVKSDFAFVDFDEVKCIAEAGSTSEDHNAAEALCHGLLPLWQDAFKACISLLDDDWHEVHAVNAALKALLAYSAPAKVRPQEGAAPGVIILLSVQCTGGWKAWLQSFCLCIIPAPPSWQKRGMVVP